MNEIATNHTFIIAAYAVTWLAILGYAARLMRAETRTRASYERATRAGAGGQDS